MEEEIEMFDKLEDILVRYDEIMKELNDPSVVNDQERFKKAYEGAKRPYTYCRGL